MRAVWTVPGAAAGLAAVPHLHERWAAGDGAGAGRGRLDGACLYHWSIREAFVTGGSASQLVEAEAGHLVGCACVDEVADCPDATPGA